MLYYNSIFINGLQVLGDNCPYYTNLYNFLYDSSNTNNDSELYTDGEYSGSYKRNSKTFTAIISTKNDNDIKSELQLMHVINKGDIPIIVDIEGLGKVECTAKKESVTTDDFGTMTITFKMCDSNIYANEYKELILEKEIEGGWKFSTNAFTIPKSWTYTENVIGNIGECINEGYSTVYPILEIEGEGSDFKIYNDTTGEKLNLNINIENGDILYINCNPAKRCVKKNGTSVIKYKSGNYISLVNGSNQLGVDYNGECSVKVRWREIWT